MSLQSQIILGFLAIIAFVTMVTAQGWTDAHATFYGDMKVGACGYDTFKEGYGLQTTALSTALFESGAKCGACFEIQCANSQWCKQGAGTIKVTATNLCPPSTGPAAWCNPPLQHFDLTELMFVTIAEYKAGIVPVQYRRVSCAKQGGVKFFINGNPNFLLVLVFNVGGAGDVTSMKIKGLSNTWTTMSRNWGMNWQVGGVWVNQALSFQVTTSDGKTIEFDAVAPSTWQFGQSFEGNSNF
ncbi:expansin-A23 [Beta vulgaris subsp. vulgaris]|uniref:expansin-A23 n=1 Tax=Beta vulgaris subsp. vulgaris TaxID=3555 RepID=UPI002549B6FE|nr:expansin-A23 [Beta vulgaris subsp. vulgaris]